MSCYNPMLAEILPFVNPKSGKNQVRFWKSVKKLFQENPFFEQWLREDGSVYYWSDDTGELAGAQVDYSTGELLGDVYRKKLILIPCGQCLACRCAYAQEWANRIMLESLYHEASYFVTLTYDENSVPRSRSPTGEDVLTLRPKDLQDFLKRLRDQQSRYKGNQIRFYGVGEYGSLRHRPHYHLIVFGLILDDLKEIGRNKAGNMLHDSETIRKLWKHGLTEVDPLTWESAAYCARYTTKKLGKAETDFYEEHGLVPEFTRMSLKPAIGSAYLQDHMEQIYKYDSIELSTAKGGRSVKPPRYYDQIYDDIYPAGMAEVKENRKALAEAAMVARLDRYDGSYLQLLQLQEEKMKQRNKQLRRNLE